MGPGPLGPGKYTKADHIGELLDSFNGAGPSRTRKVYHAFKLRNLVLASMGPGPLGPGKLHHLIDLHQFLLLQWGRALSDPESQ